MLINLLPWREQWHRRQAIRLLWINASMFALVLILLLLGAKMVRPDLMRITADLQMLQHEEKGLQKQLSQFTDTQQLWHRHSQQAAQLLQGQIVLGAMVSLLESSAASVGQPDRQIHIDNLQFNQVELKLEGSALQAAEADAFARQLMWVLVPLGWHLESMQHHYDQRRGFGFELLARVEQDDA